jgi:hypothetical protein
MIIFQVAVHALALQFKFLFSQIYKIIQKNSKFKIQKTQKNKKLNNNFFYLNLNH